MVALNKGERTAIIATVIILAIVALIGLWISNSERHWQPTPEMEQRAAEFIDSARTIESHPDSSPAPKSPKPSPTPPPTTDLPVTQ